MALDVIVEEPMRVDVEADRVHRLPDGRRLTYRLFGASGGRPVIALHGTPGSRLKYAVAHERARSLGLLLVAPDRWGYGGSDAPSGPRLCDYSDDIVHLCDALGFERFGVVGISGGGPFAAAISARLGERVSALALVAPVGVLRGAGALEGVGIFHRFCFRGLPYVPGGVGAVFAAFRGVLALNGGMAIRVAAARACSSDRRLLADPATRDGLAATFRAGLVGGTKGPQTDMALFAKSWGFDPRQVYAASRLWIGTGDRNVPIEPALRLAEAIPGTQRTIIADAGHFWISKHYGEVLEWLADQG